MIYPLFFRLVLERFDAEDAHRLARRASRALMRPRIIRRVLRQTLVPKAPELRVETLGQAFPSPLGVAAGMDKDVDWFEELGLLGFGFVEVGTITTQAQQGSPEPRIARRRAQQALLNWMGFPNPGAAVAADLLRRRSEPLIVGSNIGRTLNVAPQDAAEDYRASTRELAPCSDYMVLNVSSPNTPGLQDMQKAHRLRPLVSSVREELRANATPVPLLIKISPDLDDNELDAICDLAMELQLDGIVAVNTTRDFSNVTGSSGDPAGLRGGLSGRPLKGRALAVLRHIRQRVGDSLVLISVGGIETPEDAWDRILAGATLVQAHTGFVYGGPLWPSRMNRGLVRLVRERGGSSIQEFVGAATMDGLGGCAGDIVERQIPSPDLDLVPPADTAGAARAV